MRIGIICAMQEELSGIFLALSGSYVEYKQGGFNVYMLKYKNHELVFILSGIGKVNAALHTQYLLDKHDLDLIINVGVAGSLVDDLTFGDVLIASDLVQYDMNVVAFGLPLGQIPRMDTFSFVCTKDIVDKCLKIQANDFVIKQGRIISGDTFIDDANYAISLQQNFAALACDMEATAIAQVCYLNQIKFIVIRAVSDMAGRQGQNAIHSFNELKDMAAKRAGLVISQLLAVC